MKKLLYLFLLLSFGVNAQNKIELRQLDLSPLTTTLGLVHSTAPGVLSSSLGVQADITNGYVDQVSTQSSIGGNKTWTGGQLYNSGAVYTLSSFVDPSVGTLGSLKSSIVGGANPVAAIVGGVTGTSSVNQNTYAGYFNNASTVSGTGLAYGVYSIGALDYFSGSVGIGILPVSSSFDLLAAGTTAKSQIRFTAGVAPTSPVSGDFWRTTGSGLFFYDGTASDQFAFINLANTFSATNIFSAGLSVGTSVVNFSNAGNVGGITAGTLTTGHTYTLPDQTGTFVLTSAGRIGSATLVSGTKAISITGITSSSLAFVTRTVASGTTLTTGVTAVCTAGTLTITADVAAGTINAADGSTYNYQVVN